MRLLLVAASVAVAAVLLRPQAPPPAAPKAVELAGLHNVQRLSPDLYSGSEPSDRAAFEALAQQGIKTIVSVDGAAPQVELARELGMRYVHLPIGYDGVPQEQALRIVQATRTVHGPIYFHCHHGKHRGPAAAAIAARACAGWSTAEAVAWMQRVGTSPDYRGLYESVRRFNTPDDAALARLPTELPERVELPPLAAAMARIDRLWDELKAVSLNGATADPAVIAQALQLHEEFRELLRAPEVATREEAFVRLMQRSEQQSAELYQQYKLGEPAAAATAALGASCAQCHDQFRH